MRNKNRIRAKKSLGQHFLRSKKALVTMIKVGDVSAKDTILEIGPGTGVLTRKLLETGARVIAVEKDDELFELLKHKFEKEILSSQLILTHDDILELEAKKLITPKSWKLIANIPYNITGAILKKFLETDYQPEKIVLLIQKEVAERMVGTRRHGVSTGRKESILSISVKAYGIPRYIETVKAGSFVPVPKVDSAIIAIDDISKDFFTDFTKKPFFDMVRAGFKSKRKKLSSNLSVIFTKDKIRETFQKLNLNDNLRAEDIEIEIWRKLATHLCQYLR